MATKKSPKPQPAKPVVKPAAKPAAVKAVPKPVKSLKEQPKAKAPVASAPARPAAKPTAKAVPASSPVPLEAKPAATKAAAPAKPALKSAQPKALPSRRPSNGAIKVAIVGCAGRMGQMLLKLLINAPGVVVVGGTERRGSPAMGQDLGALAGVDPLGISVTEDPSLLFETADVVVDFTNPSATVMHAGLAAKSGCAHVIGTTGLDADQIAALGRAAQRAPIVLAANMSLGVNLLQQVVEEVARILDPEWDIEIVEMHHRHKVDAPSGTALALGDAAARGRNVALRRVARRSRDGQVGPRQRGEIGFAALRGGDVVGDHTVIFAADGERVEITHKASSREIFARGAVKAVLWAAGKKPGLYNMRDVLGFSLSGSSGAGTGGNGGGNTGNGG
jgi:4-hydroxy-tetrahydrodipicolinate reductase